MKRAKTSAVSTPRTPTRHKTGSRFRWKPDLEVFTDIAIPLEYYTDVLKRQAVVNPGVTFVLRNQAGSTFEETEFRYENGIQDYVAELAGDTALTTPVFFSDRARRPGSGGQGRLPGENQRSAVLLQHGERH